MMTSNAVNQLRREMMDRYFDDGWSVGATSKHFRRSSALVKKYIKSEKDRGRLRKKTKGSSDPRRRENRLPLSQVHFRIGVLVAKHRSRENLTMTEFGFKVGLSRIRVAELEAGSYDVSLGELQAVADELGKPVSEIIRAGPIERSVSGRLSR